MLKIRLQMTGRRNDRHFIVIVTEHTAGPKSGKYVEKIGFINPRTKENKIDSERAKYWLSVGAKPTGRVHNMLVDLGVVEGPKVNVLPQKTPIQKEDGQDGEESQNAQESEEVNNTDSGDEQSKEDSNQDEEQEQADSEPEDEAKDE